MALDLFYSGRVRGVYVHAIRRWILTDATIHSVEYARLTGNRARALAWARHYDAQRRGTTHLHPPPDEAPLPRVGRYRPRRGAGKPRHQARAVEAKPVQLGLGLGADL